MGPPLPVAEGRRFQPARDEVISRRRRLQQKPRRQRVARVSPVQNVDARPGRRDDPGLGAVEAETARRQAFQSGCQGFVTQRCDGNLTLRYPLGLLHLRHVIIEKGVGDARIRLTAAKPVVHFGISERHAIQRGHADGVLSWRRRETGREDGGGRAAQRREGGVVHAIGGGIVEDEPGDLQGFNSPRLLELRQRFVGLSPIGVGIGQKAPAVFRSPGNLVEEGEIVWGEAQGAKREPGE